MGPGLGSSSREESALSSSIAASTDSGMAMSLDVLRRHSRITAPTWRPGLDSIVPFGMPGIRLDVQRSHLGVGDLDTLGIAVLIQFTLHRQAGFGGRSGD